MRGTRHDPPRHNPHCEAVRELLFAGLRGVYVQVVAGGEGGVSMEISRIECAEIELPRFPKHSNRLPFIGILGFVDKPSEKSPTGGRGHAVVLSRKAAVDALGSIIGMGVCHSTDHCGHDAKRKIGIITKARLIGQRIVVRGILYAKDCAADIRSLREKKFGMSYEISDAHVPNLDAAVWTLDKVHFTGAALILAEKTAYKGTRFWLAREAGVLVSTLTGN